MQPFPGWNGSHRVDPRSRIIPVAYTFTARSGRPLSLAISTGLLVKSNEGWEAPKGLGGKYSPFLAMSVRVLAGPITRQSPGLAEVNIRQHSGWPG